MQPDTTANTPHFSKRSALWRCFFDRSLYADVIMRWQGLGFIYLLLLNALMILPACFIGILALDRMAFDSEDAIHQQLDFTVDSLLAQVPPMQFKNGKMESAVMQPYVITLDWENEKHPFVIIDEKGTIEDLQKSDALALLTADSFHMLKDGAVETRSWGDIDEEEFSFDSSQARALAQELYDGFAEQRIMIYAVLFLLMGGSILLVAQLYRIVQALLYGLAAVFIAGLLKSPLRYDAGVRLASVALTPAILLNLLFLAMGAGGISLLMATAITLAYLTFAIRTASRPS